MKQTWVLFVGNNYGFFFFKGTETEAEDMRKHKANWEHAICRKRLAEEIEIRTGVIDECHNHPNFNSKNRYHCECEKCKTN